MGLEDVNKAFEIKKGEDYEMYSNWLGKDELDLAKCDLYDLNFRLKKLPRIFRDSYEYGLERTERSIKILERDYKNSVNMFPFTSHVECCSVLYLKDTMK